MADYRLFFVGTARPRPGQDSAAAEWWTEKGEAVYGSLPGVKSVQTFASQFGLAGEFTLEFWLEVASYGALDRWDDAMAAEPARYGQFFEEFNELFEGGPSRLMGDWPASRLTE
jgi:hypothetical protein